MAAPKRELFKSADVCEMAQLQPYVLRSWEAEFPRLGQAPSGGGPRVYRRGDVELVLRIKQLVFGEGLTLAGARRRIDEDTQGTPSAGALSVEDALSDLARTRLRQIRAGLEEILTLLGRRLSPATAPELELVPGESPRTSRSTRADASSERHRSKVARKGDGGKRRRASA